MNFKKITPGYIIQMFNDAGEPVEQTFVAGDPVEYETEDGDPINGMDMPLGGNEYLSFDMVQPLDMDQSKIENTQSFQEKAFFLEQQNGKFFWRLPGGTRSIGYPTEVTAKQALDTKSVQWEKISTNLTREGL